MTSELRFVTALTVDPRNVNMARRKVCIVFLFNSQKLEGYTCCYLVCQVFVYCFTCIPLASRLDFILHLYMLISQVRKELSHSDLLFVCNFLRLTHEPCLGINQTQTVNTAITCISLY